MAEFIAFVNTARDGQIMSRLYKDAYLVRASCETLSKTSKHLAGVPLWLDPGVDALDKWPTINEDFKKYISNWTAVDRIVDTAFQAKPTESVVNDFVNSVLALPGQKQPTCLSVPQLPVVLGTERNKINRQLAKSAGDWKSSSRFDGRFILPVVITHPSQVKLKADRSKRIELIRQCMTASSADTVWVVDSNLCDQDGASTLESTRLPSLVAFHQELRDKLAESTTIFAGPYWGFNLVLWCRGLVDNPAIGLGNAYQYHLSGGFAKQGKSRIALPGLRRWAVASTQLKSWMESVIPKLMGSDGAQGEFQALLKQYPQIMLDGRLQVANFYKGWLSKLEAIPKPGRALAMYHDLSSAYVLGKSLPDLPKDEGTARRPERVAKQLMTFCL